MVRWRRSAPGGTPIRCHRDGVQPRDSGAEVRVVVRDMVEWFSARAFWREPRDRAAGLGSEFPLHLISGQPATRLHSQLDNGALSMREKIQGREPVLVNPADAVARGIQDGDVVRLYNGRGACLAGAKLTEDVAAGVVFLRTGAWYDPAGPALEIGRAHV